MVGAVEASQYVINVIAVKKQLFLFKAYILLPFAGTPDKDN